MWDHRKALEHLRRRAAPRSLGLCARYTREAIEAGGLVLVRQASARDYGGSLVAAGFLEMDGPLAGLPRPADVVVIEGFVGQPDGHMAMFDGLHWISDFVQRDLYPGPHYRQRRPAYRLYRYPLHVDRVAPESVKTALA